MPAEPAPLILTLDLGEAFPHFGALRDRHFPPGRNLVPAHATLFHHLPGAEPAMVGAALAAETRGRPSLRVDVEAPRSLGRGVAYGLACPALLDLRERLAARFAAWLTPQDRQGYRPHVTVQNKAEPAQARALHADLGRDFTPFTFLSPGLLLWHYRGGPWERCGRYPFDDAP